PLAESRGEHDDGEAIGRRHRPSLTGSGRGPDTRRGTLRGRGSNADFSIQSAKSYLLDDPGKGSNTALSCAKHLNSYTRGRCRVRSGASTAWSSGRVGADRAYARVRRLRSGPGFSRSPR